MTKQSTTDHRPPTTDRGITHHASRITHHVYRRRAKQATITMRPSDLPFWAIA